MVGTVGISGLRVDAVFGVYEEERVKPRPLVVDIEYTYTISRVVESDEMHDAVDYDRVVAVIRESLENGRYRTIEAATAITARTVAERFSVCKEVVVTIHKPGSVPGAEESRATVRVESR